MADNIISFPYATSTVTGVTASTVSTTLVSADNNRGPVKVILSGSATAWISYAETANSGAGNFSEFLAHGDSFIEPSYKGIMSVIFSSGSATTVVNATVLTK